MASLGFHEHWIYFISIYLNMSVYVVSAGCKRVSVVPMKDRRESLESQWFQGTHRGDWELNTHPLEEQRAILTAGPSL